MIRTSRHSCRSTSGFNPSPPENYIPIVQNDCLAGRNGALRLSEFDFQLIAIEQSGARGLGLMVVPDFGGAREGLANVDFARSEEVDLVGEEGFFEELIALGEGDAIGGRVDFGDVDGMAKRELEASVDGQGVRR